MSFMLETHKQVAPTKATTETDRQDHPKIWIQAHAMHWNITNFFFHHPRKHPPSHQPDAEQRTPLLQYVNKGGHTTWYPRYLCLTVHHPPISVLSQVNRATKFTS